MSPFVVRPFPATRANLRRSKPAIIERLEERLVLTIYTVMNTADTGMGTFRQAITAASMNVDADEIRFDPGVFSTPQTISLNSATDQTSD